MSWEPELEELKQRKAFAEELGGPERVKRQHFWTGPYALAWPLIQRGLSNHDRR